MKVVLNYAKFQLKRFAQLFIALLVLEMLFALIMIRGFEIFHELIYVAASISVGIVVLVIMGYQYQKQSMDHYYSLPITKKQLFLGNQIAAYIIVVVPILISGITIVLFSPVRYSYILGSAFHYSYFDLISMLCSITFTFLLFSLITALSNNHFDSLVLMFSYYLVPFIGVRALVAFFNRTLTGFPFGSQDSYNLIRFTTLYVDQSINLNLQQKLTYFIWFFVVSVITILITYYFVEKRKPEGIGGNFAHPIVYTVIKAIVVWIYLLGVYSSLFYTMERSIFTTDLLFPLAIGLIFYVVFTLIQKRTINIIIPSIIKYFILVIVFFATVTIYTNVLRWNYINRIPSQVESVTLDLNMQENKYSVIDIVDMSTGKSILRFNNQDDINEVLNVHKNIMHYQGYTSEPAIDFIYNKGHIFSLHRKYYVSYITLNRLLASLYLGETFQKEIKALIQPNVTYTVKEGEYRTSINATGEEILNMIQTQISKNEIVGIYAQNYVEVGNKRIYFKKSK